MANTVIQLKRSTTTATPANGSLSISEPAYSYNSDKLFLGNTTGSGVIEIGGKYWVDTTQAAFDQANAAYIAANTGISNSSTFIQANTARDQANSAFEKANSANLLAFNTGAGANAYTQAVGTAGNTYAESIGTAGNNYTITVGAAANGWANTVGVDAKNYANGAFVKLTSPTQIITGDISITGNLSILGNTTTVNTNDLVINDPVFLLANNNITDIVDIGFVAHYANLTNDQVHTGLIRDPGTKQWYFFKDYNDHFIYQGGNINLTGNNFTLDTVNANFVTNNLWLGGANAILTIGAAFNKANAANLLAFNTGAGANAYTDTVGAAANTNASNASYINTGTLAVAYGGTGTNSFTLNGILYGNTSGVLNVTAAGTEGQVLQASSTGVPLFADIDGGNF